PAARLHRRRGDDRAGGRLQHRALVRGEGERRGRVGVEGAQAQRDGQGGGGGGGGRGGGGVGRRRGRGGAGARGLDVAVAAAAATIPAVAARGGEVGERVAGAEGAVPERRHLAEAAVGLVGVRRGVALAAVARAVPHGETAAALRVEVGVG